MLEFKNSAYSLLTQTPLAAFNMAERASAVLEQHLFTEHFVNVYTVGYEVTVMDEDGKPVKYPNLLAAAKEIRRPPLPLKSKVWGLVFNSRGELTHRFNSSGGVYRMHYLGLYESKEFATGPCTRQILGL